MKTTTKVLYDIILALFILMLCCCNSQQITNSCIEKYTKARTAFNSYLLNDDTCRSKLTTILSTLDSNMDCSGRKMAIIELKISILLKLQEYAAGFAYIDSLQDNDFKYPYRRQMWSFYFKALSFEKIGDKISSNNYFNGAIQCIQAYIQKFNIKPNMTDGEPYLDLFKLKTYTQSMSQLDLELNALRITYPNDTLFLEYLEFFVEDEINLKGDVSN